VRLPLSTFEVRSDRHAQSRVRIVTSAVDEGLEHLLTDGHTSLKAGASVGGDRQPWTSFLVA
jgi:hypothetical protein